MVGFATVRWMRLAAVAAAVLASGLSLPSSEAAERVWKHGTALMGEVKRPAGFSHFDYVNPNAPKGGRVRFGAMGTFDSLNPINSLKGTPAAGISLIYDQLLATALDEPSTMYGHIAEAMSYPTDYSSVTFRLNPAAKWHDGTPITPEDVIWSLDAAKQSNPGQAFYYKNVKSAEKTGEREVTFTFDEAGNRELPHIVGQLTILPKHWWTGTGADGKPRDIMGTSLEPPLGGGAYRVKTFEAGRYITYERVKDYWAADLNVNVGKNNFDELHYEYYRDETVLVEAFKGDRFDWRTENSAKNWATAYDFPAQKDGRVILESFPERGSGVMVGFVFNMRDPKFQDPRVRLAFNYAFNFEDMNRTVFFGQYVRPNSYFFGLDLASSGLPQGRELELLQAAKEKGPIPEEVFTKTYANPVVNQPADERTHLREALRLLREAGWETRDGKLVNTKTGQPFQTEFMINSPTFERVAVPFRAMLGRLGIDVTVRNVDPSQYVNRIRSRDFQIIYTGWGQSQSPGNEQRDYFGSEAADRESSRNHGGIKNPAIDFLIDQVIFAKDRAELEHATRALDRVLLWNHYVVPGWTLNATRAARWDRFSRPDMLPRYAEPAFPTVWWWDEAKVAKTGAPR
jgi:microcin C transport system substrate-binding protein